jgi:hypothetical protein
MDDAVISSRSIGPSLYALRCRAYLAFYRSRVVRPSIHTIHRGINLLVAAMSRPGDVVRRLRTRLRNNGKSPDVIVSASRRELLPRSRTSSSTLPIVFIHQANSDYLKYALAQAHKSNPQSAIYLVGDASTERHEFVEQHSMFDYFHGAARFAAIYKHYSTHPIGFELINFQRWFILREFLIANGLERCLYLDSDTMLYANVTEDSRKFKHFDFTLSHGMIGCTFFLNRFDALTEFCDFLVDIYAGKDKYAYDRLVAHFTARRMNGLPGGACDMTALQLYNELHFGEIGEVTQVIDGSVYDPAITSPVPGFEMQNGIKKLVWKDGIPYGTHVRTGEQVRFNSLHLQGQTKHLMGHYYRQNIETARFCTGAAATAD